MGEHAPPDFKSSFKVAVQKVWLGDGTAKCSEMEGSEPDPTRPARVPEESASEGVLLVLNTAWNLKRTHENSGFSPPSLHGTWMCFEKPTHEALLGH